MWISFYLVGKVRQGKAGHSPLCPSIVSLCPLLTFCIYSRSCDQRPCHQRPFVSNDFFFLHGTFSIVNDLWSTTFCLTRLATSNIWQKVIILLVLNDLNFFRHTTFGNNHEQTTACQIWLCGYHGLTQRYNAGRSGWCRKRSIYLRPSMLLHSNITSRR